MRWVCNTRSVTPAGLTNCIETPFFRPLTFSCQRFRHRAGASAPRTHDPPNSNDTKHHYPLCSHEMESKSYKELQALAKLHGIRANQSKAALIDKLASHKLQGDAQQDSSSSQGNAEKPQADSDAPEGNPGKPRDEAKTPSNDSATPEGNVDKPRLNHADQPQDVLPTATAADVSASVDTNTALPDPGEPEVPMKSSETSRKEKPEVPVETSDRKSDRLSAAKKVRIKRTSLS